MSGRALRDSARNSADGAELDESPGDAHRCAVFTVPGGDTLSLISGHRGELAMDDGRSYAIDL